MKRLLFLSLLGLVAMGATAQENGIHFEHHLTWEQILAQARAEHKPIFVDCYTTWCSPCKLMAKKVFTTEKVGAFYNKHFINVKMQMDTSARDNEEIKRYYSDAHYLAKKYNVKNYPTLLFFNSEGQLVESVIGVREEDIFLQLGNDLVYPESALKSNVEAYKTHPGDTVILKKLARRYGDLDKDMQKEVAVKYLTLDGDRLNAEKIDFILKNTRSTGDKGFELARKYPEAIDRKAGSGSASDLVTFIIVKEEIMPEIRKHEDHLDELDWVALGKKVIAKYPKEVNKVILEGKKNAMDFTADPEMRIKMTEQLIKEYEGKAPTIKLAEIMNVSAMGLLMEDNPELLPKALQWSRKAALTPCENKEKSGNFKDTYALFLYKSGNRKEGIKFEKEALLLAEKDQNQLLVEFRKEVLKRMENSEKDPIPTRE